MDRMEKDAEALTILFLMRGKTLLLRKKSAARIFKLPDVSTVILSCREKVETF